MSDKPVIFSAPMVRALLDGRKTQTRRVVKLADDLLDKKFTGDLVNYYGDNRLGMAFEGTSRVQPLRYAIGDRLWVRETHSLHYAHGQRRTDWRRWGPWDGLPMAISPDGTQVAYYREGFDRSHGGPWRSSTQMPRWASRITLTITEVRVQRVQDISEQDAIAEGVEWINPPASLGPDVTSEEIYGIGCQIAFHDLWDMIYGPDAWDRNDWVECYTFTVQRGNIDAGGDHD